MSSDPSPISLFEAMFAGLSLPAMLVAENSKVVAINEKAAGLFLMPAEDIIGQRWAGLDANATLVQWRSILAELGTGDKHVYQTDIETSRRFMRPINVEVRRTGEGYALVTLTDLIKPDIVGNELDLLGSELQLGRWSYNRVDSELNISDVGRKLLGIPAGPIDKAEIGEMMRQKMVEGDFIKLAGIATKLLATPSQESADFVIESAEGTSRFNFTCRSLGNELHVTHLYGLVRRRIVHEATKPDATHFAELAAFSLEQAKAMIFWTRPDGTVRYANSAVSDELGYTPNEMLGLNVIDFAPSFSEEAKSEFWKNLRIKKHLDLEYALVGKGGDEILISSVVNYIRFGQEEFACSINRNISLQKNEDRRRRLMEFTIDRTDEMIVWSRPDGSIYSANDTYLEKSGHAKEELGSMTVAAVFGKADIITTADWEALRGGQIINKKTSLITKDGRTIPIRAKLNYLNYEGEELQCVYLFDISSEVEKDRQLSLSKVALDTAADCILWLNDQLRIQYANETLRRLLPGSKSQSIIGRDVAAVFPSIDRDLIGPGETQDFEMQTSDGTSSHMNLTCSKLDHGGVHYFVLSARDVSNMAQERQELETAFTEIEVMRDRLRDENFSLREENEKKYNVNNIITVSKQYQKILTQVGQVADVNTTVLITGETGTGKELLARAVHQLSAREDFPLVKVNCAALPESLIESELFGHEKGAFTGAINRKKGRFEMADRGTIFLDEIGELPLDLQSKLLRVLQEDEFTRVGGEQTIKVDVRLIAATNRNLEDMVRGGKFREDLYYRLNVFPIHNLPLRERPDDIPVLIEYFTKKYAKRQGKRISRINTSDINRLKSYAFPGNIRELENIIERSVVLCQSDTLSIEFIRSGRPVSPIAEVFLSFEEMQRKHIIDALKMTGGRVTGPEGAGVLLEINDRTLVSKIRKLGIEKNEYLV